MISTPSNLYSWVIPSSENHLLLSLGRRRSFQHFMSRLCLTHGLAQSSTRVKRSSWRSLIQLGMMTWGRSGRSPMQTLTVSWFAMLSMIVIHSTMPVPSGYTRLKHAQKRPLVSLLELKQICARLPRRWEITSKKINKIGTLQQLISASLWRQRKWWKVQNRTSFKAPWNVLRKIFRTRR